VSPSRPSGTRSRFSGLPTRAGQVTVELTDYRQVQGTFDAIVSVEMIEAVSERYWPDYFSAIGRLLAPGGLVGLQSITMPHPRMRATRRTRVARRLAACPVQARPG
jgi:cyclopropane fatty-acyl-phospholipid synthase-like methyltransferase